MLPTLIVLLLSMKTVLSSTSSGMTVTASTDVSKANDVVCHSTEVRNNIAGLKQLVNCTIIEGFLRIVLITNDDINSFRNVSLPNLREITDYLLLYRVQHMRTLSNIFPNLSVIRGRRLFYHFSLIVYELFFLEDLGLSSLMLIERGAVHVSGNPQLCYLDTIDWKLIVKADVEAQFYKNNKVDNCINIYPQAIEGCLLKDVLLSDGQSVKTPQSWNFNTCQKICPSSCLGGACYVAKPGSLVVGHQGLVCCASECIGGCSGPTNADCFACRRIKYRGRCESRCPRGLLELNGWRCVTQAQCGRLPVPNGNKAGWKIFTENGVELCLRNCPTGYKESEADRNRCVQCSGSCAKVCSRIPIIDNIQAAQKLEGCVIVDGVLEIQIRGGNILDLEKYLGDIQEVRGYVRVSDSHMLTNLGFLKSLRLIRGKRLYQDEYAFFALRNRNLDGIWDFSSHPNLTIMNGTIFFLDNPKLCLYVIYDFLNAAGRQHDTSDVDIFQSSNGDLAVCNHSRTALYVDSVGDYFAEIRWENVAPNDLRYLLTWVVYYRAAPENSSNSVEIVKEVCGSDEWQSLDVDRETTSCTLLNLLPFTKYLVYVNAYMSRGVKHGAMSVVRNFTTKMTAPSVVTNLQSRITNSTELVLTWSPPEHPNGLVTHYIISWSKIEVDLAKYEQRDYCKNRGHYQTNREKQLKLKAKDRKEAVTRLTHSNLNANCCQCTNQKKIDDTERKFKIALEHFIQDNLFFKGNPSEMDISTEDASMAFDVALTSAIRRNSSSALSFHSDNILSQRKKFSSLSFGQSWNSTIVFENTSAVISGLMHFQDILIEVIACHRDEESVNETEKLCSMPAIIVARTLADESADNIEEGNVSSSYISGAVFLNWASPKSPNALTTAFEVELSKVDIKDYKPDVLCTSFLDYKELKGMNISKILSPGNWSFRIRSISLSGNGSWTNFHYFSIEHHSVGAGDLQYLLALLAIIPVLLLAFVVLMFYLRKVKRDFSLYPEVISYNPEYINRDDLYEADGWEIERDQVKLLEAIGQGSFGMVYRGQLLPTSDHDQTTIEVAVKTVNDTASIRDRIAFLQEASVMKAFDSYHIVKLLGIVSKGHPSLVVMELMPNGDLKTFLRQCRPDDMNNEGRRPPTLKQTLQMASEIADGMAYLGSKKFVHRDLAARNCMVGKDYTVKIGDFGLTRDIYATEYYRKNSKGLLPVRWMAPESLKDGIFTTHSDIWSYGVVIWEMATLATQPYQGFSNEEVLHFVIGGGKMVAPDGCPEKLAKLMSMCWNSQPDKRPTFDDIIQYLLPDLSSKFYEVSHYFTRAEDRKLPLNTEKKEFVQLAESEDDEAKDANTHFGISFPLKSPTAKETDHMSNGIVCGSHHILNGDAHALQAKCRK